MEISYQTRLERLSKIIIDKPLIKSHDLKYIIEKEEKVREIAKERNIEDPVIVAIGGGSYSQVLFNVVGSREEIIELRNEAIKNNYSISPSYLMLDLNWFNKKNIV